MHGRLSHRLLTLLLAVAAALSLNAQQKPKDDKVLLISARSAQIIDQDGESLRKVLGPAKFFHNDTYLLCDTALWNVNTNIIDAMGNVRIIQDRTQLTSATLQYVVDENMARFRGDLVQLEDSDHNTLRTRYLDYNTKDSVAVFQNGAAMRDKDGQVIESLFGTYDSKEHLFVFNDQVNMYMDTTFIKTSRLEYRSDISTAYFGFGTDMWQDDNMLSANDGWYDRKAELFFFRRKVHLLTPQREIWADSLYYQRAIGDLDMLGNVEVMDTTRNVYALAGRIEYTDSLAQVRMTREPAIMSVTEENQQRDTVYMGADLLLSRAIRRCDIPEEWLTDSQKRLSDIAGDPVMEYRKKAAEAAAKAAEEAAAKLNAGNRPPGQGGKPAGGKPSGGPPPEAAAAAARMGAAAPGKDGSPKPPSKSDKPPVKDSVAVTPPADTTGRPALPDSLSGRPALPDSLGGRPAPPDTLDRPALPEKPEKPELPDDPSLPEPPDTLATPADTLSAPLDTTKVNFLWGSSRVRLFRRNLQMASDSLNYCDLDSLVRLYKDPIVFSDGNRQYVADSIYMVIRNKKLDTAHLLSNAFITIEEAPHAYDQVRGTEMIAYFDSSTVLTRFDALGGASSLFYLEENGALATVNKVDSKMIYATFVDGNIDHMYYYDNPKNDGYPTVQLPEEEKTLKGFRWEPERRPASPLDVTSLVPRPSERLAYLARPHTDFQQTEDYFPGYINKVYRDIAIRDSLQVVREREARIREDSLRIATLAADSLAVTAPKDSLSAGADSLSVRPAPTDSLTVPRDSLAARTDSLSVRTDSLTVPPVVPVLTEAERKAAEKAAAKAAKEAARAEREAALEAKWAEQDRIDAEKKAAKEQKKLEKERARKRRELLKLEKRAQRERKRLEKYLKREQARKLKSNKK